MKLKYYHVENEPKYTPFKTPCSFYAFNPKSIDLVKFNIPWLGKRKKNLNEVCGKDIVKELHQSEFITSKCSSSNTSDKRSASLFFHTFSCISIPSFFLSMISAFWPFPREEVLTALKQRDQYRFDKKIPPDNRTYKERRMSKKSEIALTGGHLNNSDDRIVYEINVITKLL